MRYRHYKGYIIKKNYNLNSYSVFTKDYKEVHFDYLPQHFAKLKDAKEFIDQWENGELINTKYSFR